MMSVRNIKIILFIVIITILLWLFILDFVPGEKLEINYNFCERKPMITELSPGDRLWPIKKINNNCSQDIAASPVYFDTRAPQYFDSAKVEIKYKNLNNQEFKLGPQIIKDEWMWQLQDVIEIDKIGEWQTGKAEFNLNNIYQNSNVMRWLISAPTIEENKTIITISKIKIIFYKQPVNFSNFLEQIKSYLRKIVR